MGDSIRRDANAAGLDYLRMRLTVRGIVQGVGFRPFVYRLATELHLTGWVTNSSQGVHVEVEGPHAALEEFLLRLEREKPPPAAIQSLEPSFLDGVGYEGFHIRPSVTGGEKRALILPDLATCTDCLRELFDPSDRRYRYPFINCTLCGPRFSIITALPYDRPNTTMRGFRLCDRCRAEYEDPRDRRFHAQPNACPACGPSLELWDAQGGRLTVRDDALLSAAQAIRAGKIVAVKGIGGFHLMVDARNEEAVVRLRSRKHREEKPFALMAPSLQTIQTVCQVAPLEERLLRSPEAPIVLLTRHTQGEIAPAVAPGNPALGFMLPATPLHHLLMAELGFPLVATSGNRSDEPICTDEAEVVARLGGIADLFLIHDRPIARHVDDSVARITLGREMLLRRARGYAPLPITLHCEMPPALAVGAHLKNAVAISVGREAFLSQHVGDLETAEAYHAFTRVIDDLTRLYEARPEAVACDLHPDYLSTQYAERCGLAVRRVQHHVAHVLACMAENDVAGSALGVSWDGIGYGEDKTLWGGEFLLVGEANITRMAHLRPFLLPGGETAIREPRRSALGLLHALFGHSLINREEFAPVRAFTAAERRVALQALEKGINAPQTSSAGRLFDAVASLLDMRQRMNYEGQAAMELEAAASGVMTRDVYPWRFTVRAGGALLLDWEPLIGAMMDDMRAGVPTGLIAARFHNSLAEGIVQTARHAGEKRVVLSGGCFVNRYLLEATVNRLREEGFQPYWPQRVPPGDGAIALGQLAAIGRARRHVSGSAG